jgi:exosortase/archaeosortase family protein
MLSLSALGALFVYLMSRTSRWHNALMLASLLPIAFVANLGRVLLLALITFHHGDASAQALHAGLGLSVFVIALVLLIGLDGVLARLHANPPR